MEDEKKYLDLSKKIATELSEYNAKKIEILDVTKKSKEIKFIILSNAIDEQFAKVLAKDITEFIKQMGIKVLRTDGDFKGEWIVIDCDEIVINILTDKTRSKYNLEKLWKDGKNSIKFA